MSLKGIIFDLDGVICSTDEYHYKAWKQLADGLGMPFDREVNNLLRGVSRMDSLEIILKHGHAEQRYSSAEKEILVDQKNEIYKRSLQNMTPESMMPYVPETLDELRKKNLLLGIGSSSKNTPMILEKIGMGQYFDAVCDGNQITHSKPNPEVFEKAAQMLKLKPEEAIVVEDAVPGAEAGHRAGMKVICVGDAASKGAGDWNIDDFRKIPDIADGLMKS